MEGALTLAADCIAEPHWYLHRSANGIPCKKSMKYTAAEIEEARRLAQQAEGQVTAQMENDRSDETVRAFHRHR